MPESINNNLMAANVASNLNSHYGKLATTVERLSSGLRINSAADDAAGLAIRELMRADVAALNQGVRNANDAISMLQVADGALGIIDEKLIRMKELAEQAATGTYNSTQRLMIHSEFVAMAEEIDRIARTTDFNSIKLLDGSLQGEHDGSGLNATGKLKVHFGSANDSAEDYYYVEIGDCTLAGLGLRDLGEHNADAVPNPPVVIPPAPQPEPSDKNVMQMPVLNDINSLGSATWRPLPYRQPDTLQDFFKNKGEWYTPLGSFPDEDLTESFIFIIPKGTKNIVINSWGTNVGSTPGVGEGDQDLQLFTKDGVHLAGTPLDDFVYGWVGSDGVGNTIDENGDRLGFTSADYNGSYLNSGPPQYDSTGKTLQYSKYKDMIIGYGGDPDRHDAIPNNGSFETWKDCEVLTIDEAKEDLVVWLVGGAAAAIKAYWDLPEDPTTKYPPLTPNPPDPGSGSNPPNIPVTQGDIISIKTQEKAQQALERIDDAIVAKDQVRAHLGALQNRLENTVTNLTIQGENLQTAESRISDIDVATEMTALVRNQVLTQSAVAMLGQANSYPHMLSGLITS